MRAWLALLRPYRSELMVGLLLAGVVVLAAGGVALRMLAFDIPAGCFAGIPAIDCEPYRPAIDDYEHTISTLGLPALAVTIVIPVLVAVVLGVALVAREIEQQTTVFAWSMAPSRRRWLLRRAALVGALVIGLGLLGGLLGDALVGLERPHLDPYRNFELFGLRGLVIPAAALLAFGLAVLAGAILGRQLPTLLVAGLLLVPALLGASVLSDTWLQGEAEITVIEHPDQPFSWTDGARSLDSLIRTPDGDIVSWEEAYNRYGEAVDSAGSEGSQFFIAIRYVPGDRYPLAAARLAGSLASVGLIAILLTALVVHRRRPYQ